MRYLTHLPPAGQRAVALLVLSLFLAIVWAGVILPSWTLVRSQATWRHRTELLLATQRGKAETVPDLASQADSLKTAKIWQALIPATTEDAASEQLQRELRAIADHSGARDLRIQPLPVWHSHGFDAFVARGSASMTAMQLQKFASEIRSAPHFLRVERLTISAPQVQNADQNPDFSVTFDVVGFSRHAPDGPVDPGVSAPRT